MTYRTNILLKMNSLTKSVKAVTGDTKSKETDLKRTMEKNYQKATANAINKVKQDLTMKEIEQRMRQQRNETLSGEGIEPEVHDTLKVRSNCKTLKMEIEKLFGITKKGARIKTIITVGAHGVMRNLSEPSDQTLGKSKGVDSRYTKDYGPQEVILKIDGVNIYTKMMITCDDDLKAQIFVGREVLEVRSIGNCTMFEEDTIHLGTEAEVSAHVFDINRKMTSLKGLLDLVAVLSVRPIETWTRMGLDKDDFVDSGIRLSAANKGALKVLGRKPIISLNMGNAICG